MDDIKEFGMKKLQLMVAACFLSVPAAAYALDLSAARAAGAVCEQPDGYVRAVKDDAQVKALVVEVNARRRAEYTRISKQNNQPVSVVGQLATPQILAGGGVKVCP
jgi:uncharacterized protein YdbL (DUF1318 family)